MSELIAIPLAFYLMAFLFPPIVFAYLVVCYQAFTTANFATGVFVTVLFLPAFFIACSSKCREARDDFFAEFHNNNNNNNNNNKTKSIQQPKKKESVKKHTTVSYTRKPTKEEIKRERNKMTKKVRARILARDNYTCQICGLSREDEPHLALHVDHIIPVSKGGKTVDSNLQCLCWQCNLKKSDKI